jgi:ribosomal protein L14E/L6E/L27E
MTDTQVDPGTTEQQAAEVAAMKPADAPQAVAVERPCTCQQFQLVGKEDPDEVFQTECGRTTKSVFAQGHDARLVSFLVDGHNDGYGIRRTVDNVASSYATPAEAVAGISDALRNKAETATKNAADRLAAKEAKAAQREKAKTERQAAKAAEKEQKAKDKEAAASGPKATGAEVVAGSAEGDSAPLAEGQVRIKVGRWTYAATQLADGGVQFTNGKGEVETREEGDGYTVLEG